MHSKRNATFCVFWLASSTTGTCQRCSPLKQKWTKQEVNDWTHGVPEGNWSLYFIIFQHLYKFKLEQTELREAEQFRHACKRCYQCLLYILWSTAFYLKEVPFFGGRGVLTTRANSWSLNEKKDPASHEYLLFLVYLFIYFIFYFDLQFMFPQGVSIQHVMR